MSLLDSKMANPDDNFNFDDLFEDNLNAIYGIRQLMELEEQPENTDNIVVCEDPLATSSCPSVTNNNKRQKKMWFFLFILFFELMQ